MHSDWSITLIQRGVLGTTSGTRRAVWLDAWNVGAGVPSRLDPAASWPRSPEYAAGGNRPSSNAEPCSTCRLRAQDPGPVLDARADDRAQGLDGVIGKAIQDQPPLATPPDDPAEEEALKML